MNSRVKCQSKPKISNSTFCLLESDEFNISDEILSEGNVETETIRDSISLENMENTPMTKFVCISPHFGRNKINLSWSEAINIELDLNLSSDSKEEMG